SNPNSVSGSDNLLLERQNRVLKKLLVTGNGQGNLTNEIITKENYFGEEDFIKAFIENEKKINLKKYLYSKGIPLTVENNKVFPLSKTANSVVDTLRSFIENKIEIKLNSLVESVTKEDKVFVVKTKDETFYSKNVILSVGGKSGKQFGTDGSSYKLATSFGHKLTKLYPSLVQIKTEQEKIKMLRGIREEVRLSVIEKDREIYSTEGDVIFTDYGVSGNAVFKASSYIVDKDDIKIKLDFLKDLTEAEVVKIITDRIENAPNIKREEILSGIVNKKISETIIKEAKDSSVKGLAKELKNFTLKVTGNLGFDYSQVTRGGIVTLDVDKSSYMSKFCKGLYLTGETLDIDGECGGYNLTFAFITGIVSAKSIKGE
ncbi:MAG: aminoacetone oxidase family FAD-binding enzyme, partial [Firmicutes bacterium]|nr:aminoacetone oxidase family FAD-binding enzyme [Candidatus Caballimonas caccae]